MSGGYAAMSDKLAGGGLDGLDGLDGMDGLDGLLGKSGDDDVEIPCFEDLTPFEVEHFIQDLQEFKPEDVGSSRWLTQHERVEKLNWTAHTQAKEGLDEYVVDQFNTLEKGPTMIYDLILTEVWKEQIWPLVKNKIAKFSSLRTYIPVYHEASVANLIEICLFHRTTCEEMGDALVDLVDWCVRKLRHLLATPNHELVPQVENAKDYSEWEPIRYLDEQFIEVEFQVCMCVISILRFLTDHRVAMPLAVTTRLLETHDVLLLLVPLMEKAPWVRKKARTGKIQKFEDHQWEDVDDEDTGRLPKLHTQVWLTIYNLVMDAECRARYELSSFRRENLLKLRRYINEVVVDQLPPLTNLHRTLEEMAISGQFTGANAANAPIASPFVVELVAEARESLVRSYEGRWQEVADFQLREVLVKETPEELKRLGQMISVPKEMLEEPAPPQQNGAGPVAADDSDAISSDTAVSAWKALVDLPLVKSTASFFAASRSDAPLDEIIVLSASAGQGLPREGDQLQLELRRTRHSLLNQGQGGRAAQAANAQMLAKMAAAAEGDGTASSNFSLAVDAPGISLADVHSMPFVSSKGVAKTGRQLREMLAKPGLESTKAMYSEDVAKFSVRVGGDGGISAIHIKGLSLAK
jgi:hypothetical protein